VLDDVLVVADGAIVRYAGPRSERPADLPDPDEELLVDGFLMPAVVDRHVHIRLADPAAVVRNGVTAVRDLGWIPEEVFALAADSTAPGFDGPVIRGVGAILTCHEGYPSRASWAPPGTALEVSGADEAVQAANDMLDRNGVAVVKVALNAEAGPTLRDDELLAICDAAHRRQASVTAHVQGLGQAERALGAGVDEFAHTPWTERLPDDLVQAMARRMRIVSTLDIHSYGHDTPELRTAVDNLGRFVAAGGTVAYGTDLGNGPIPAGIDADEARHLRRAGLSSEGLLEAMTYRPLAPGEPASLVVVGGNPLEDDLDCFLDLRLMVHAGRRLP
jgi:imidazolonepropionase-like amidohydrolase